MPYRALDNVNIGSMTVDKIVVKDTLVNDSLRAEYDFDLVKFSKMDHKSLSGSLQKDLQGANIMALESSQCPMDADSVIAFENESIPFPSASCRQFLKEKNLKYLIYAPIAFAEAYKWLWPGSCSPGPSVMGISGPEICTAGGFVISPRLKTILVLYSVEKNSIAQMKSHENLFEKDDATWKAEIEKFNYELTKDLPIDNASETRRKKNIRKSQEAVELSFGSWKAEVDNGPIMKSDFGVKGSTSNKGTFWELRYLSGGWQIGASWSQQKLRAMDPICDLTLYSIIAGWNPFVSESGWRLGVHSTLSYASADPDSSFLIAKGTSGLGYGVGAHLDKYLGLGLTAGARVGWATQNLKFDEVDLSFNGMYLQFTVGWGPRFNWFR